MKNPYLEELLSDLKTKYGILVNQIDNIQNSIDDGQIEYLLKKHILSLYRTILDARKAYLDATFALEQEAKEFNAGVSNLLGFKLSKVETVDYTLYKLDIPFLLPKHKELIDAAIWNTCIESAYIKMAEISGHPSLIAHPFILFHNCYMNNIKGLNIKDNDNFEQSRIINLLQYRLIGDDRYASIMSISKYGNDSNCTSVYITSTENTIETIKLVTKEQIKK